MKNTLRTIMILTLALYCTACSKVTEEEFIGTYCLKYGDGIEKLDIMPNGTYKLTYKILGKFIFDYEGTWEFEKRMEDGELFVSFANSLWAYEFYYNQYEFWQKRSEEELKSALEKRKNNRNKFGQPKSYWPFRVYRTLTGDIIIPTHADVNIDYIKSKNKYCK